MKFFFSPPTGLIELSAYGVFIRINICIFLQECMCNNNNNTFGLAWEIHWALYIQCAIGCTSASSVKAAGIERDGKYWINTILDLKGCNRCMWNIFSGVVCIDLQYHSSRVPRSNLSSGGYLCWVSHVLVCSSSSLGFPLSCFFLWWTLSSCSRVGHPNPDQDKSDKTSLSQVRSKKKKSWLMTIH